MLEIYAVRLDYTFEKNKYDELLTCIAAEKRERVGRFFKYEDALRTLISDILVRYLVCDRLKVKNKELLFSANEYGKPFLANYDGIQYNTSHSGRWVVCALADSPVGIDVEQIKPIDLRIAERFFSKEEFASLMSKEEAHREEFFYELWASKESYIKAIGRGLSIPLDSFSVNIGEKSVRLDSQYQAAAYFFKKYFVEPGFKMVACSCGGDFPEKVEFMEANELYERALRLFNQ
ncbi:4'-phosphopantetheinyl transferase sfp [Ruminiclostridium hungatei]|uniref:4'-phosphopantetheinyl transferase sfp n=1 Tax=Ruminiclostridium hungatei TaxID=48256 RepID=A0A1V4SH13_RUMHU|nr:4'-phosphopantetheinyl transferase superfamily protein [Ruminiclostridium hungatei]OPX43168.1 4'-phosphopantetheinyl transferase sfp [Ruminiclostridium hungatei]